MKDISLRRVALLISIFLFVVSTCIAIAAATYHGNIDSWIFHDSGCRYYDCKNCIVEFETRQEAIEAGYRPCKICKP